MKNATTCNSSQKLLNKSCTACGNFIVVTKQEILVISLSVFFDAISRRHNDIILKSFGVYLITVPVNLVYVKLWGLATKIRF